MYYLMYMCFSEEDFGPKNQKFESFRKSPRKINSLLSECCALWRRVIYVYYPNLHLIVHSALLDMPCVISPACIAGMLCHNTVPP